ncbi:MAG: hypothetical protein ACK5IJ_09055 [Mangrovibacterium sp.]
MTTKTVKISRDIKIGEMNSLAQAILNKSDLFTSTDDDHLTDLILRIGMKQEELNNAIMCPKAKANSKAHFVEMKQSFRMFYDVINSFAQSPNVSPYSAAFEVYEVVHPYAKKILNCTNQLTCNSYVSSVLADLEKAEVKTQLQSIVYITGL